MSRIQADDVVQNLPPAGLCTDSEEFASKQTLGRDRSLIHARNWQQLTRGVASGELQKIPPSQAESK